MDYLNLFSHFSSSCNPLFKVVPPGSIKPTTGAREKLGFGPMTSDWANSFCMWSRADPNEHVDTSSTNGLDVYSTHIAVRKSRKCMYMYAVHVWLSYANVNHRMDCATTSWLVRDVPTLWLACAYHPARGHPNTASGVCPLRTAHGSLRA